MDPKNRSINLRPFTVKRKSDKHGRITLPDGWENKYFEVYLVEVEGRKGLLLLLVSEEGGGSGESGDPRLGSD